MNFRIVYNKKIDNSFIIRIVTFVFTVSLFFERSGNILFFYCSFLLFAIISSILAFNTIKNTMFPIILWRFILFVFLSGLSIIWAINKIYAFQMLIRLIIIAFIIIFIYLNNKKYDTINAYTFGLVAGVIINFLLYLSPYRSIYFEDPSGRFSGTLNNANSFSILIIFSIYFYFRYCIRKKKPKQLYFIIYSLVSSILILSTDSRKGLVFGLLLIIVCIYYMNKESKHAKGITLISVIFLIPILFFLIRNNEGFNRLILFFDFLRGGEGDQSTRWRVYFLIEGFKIIKSNFFLGVGIDNFQTFTGEGLYAHNNYIEILSDLGVIGFILLYSIYFHIYRTFKKSHAHSVDYWLLIIVMTMELFFVSYYFRAFWISIIYLYSMGSKGYSSSEQSQN